ncbi:MAG: sugar transporter, partial [Flavobacterium sp.]|nr:sugar transporter [Flavobacterium sp.]
ASERVTLLEAISMAGDMTIYGKRSNVLVIREVDGKKTFNRVDLTNKDFISSPFYYLNQNDVVMVEPNKTKINSSVIGPNVTVTISAISLLTTIAIILFK